MVFKHYDYDSVAVHVVVVVLCACIMGALASYFLQVLLRFLTAFAGGYFAVAGVDHFVYRFGWWHNAPLDPAQFFDHTRDFHCTDNLCFSLLGVWGFLFLVGVLFQFHLVSRENSSVANKSDINRPFLEDVKWS
eukprot:TRINITY_DN7721_c0_g1_i5.p1 TRINITY_DN7721_c0_g1~~TRINITY_DN7721_c0_g1_i5.p1  ORF type:complete len:134 (-),score=43.83 TRINITY_DN7721_c0_g1_i5:28-429(-)